MEKKYENIESTLHAILSGVLMNGWLQGKSDSNINTNVITVALEEIKKILPRENFTDAPPASTTGETYYKIK